jgi:hypothetical protein
MASTDKPETLHTRIANSLRERIYNHEWQANKQIPTEPRSWRKRRPQAGASLFPSPPSSVRSSPNRSWLPPTRTSTTIIYESTTR